MNNINTPFDASYSSWSERTVVADCLLDLGMKKLASKAILPATPQELINQFLNIIKREACKVQKHDVLERLYYAGLIG